MGEQAVTYAINDRVMLKPCPSWNQPWRGMAAEGRLATVCNIRESDRWAPYKISFDVKRKNAKPRELWVAASDISPAQKDPPHAR